MNDHSKENAGVGESVDLRVKTRHMLVAARKTIGVSSQEKTPGSVIRKSPRVAVQIPFSYRAIRNDRVMPDTFLGTILDISYGGMMVELNPPLPAHSEIKLNLDALLSYARATDIDAGAAEIYARVIDTRPVNGQNVSGIEFICVSEQNKKLLMHCMLHIAHAGNAPLDEYLSQQEQEGTKKTEVWRIIKRIVLITLLAGSFAAFFLISQLNEALTAVH